MKFVTYIIKNDWYSLSLISNLLIFSHKAHIYTRIDLYHTYYLICIIQDNKWKIVFYTYYRYLNGLLYISTLLHLKSWTLYKS